MIRGIHHVAVSTPDLDRIVSFYRDVIGAKIVYEGGWSQGSDVIDDIVGMKNSACRQAMLKLGNAYLEFFPNGKHALDIRSWRSRARAKLTITQAPVVTTQDDAPGEAEDKTEPIETAAASNAPATEGE